MGTLKIGTDPLRQLPCRQDAIRLDHAALAMDSVGFQRVQPRAFDRQWADYDAHSGLLPLDLVVVRSDPGAYRLTPVPRGVVPDQEHSFFALSGELVTAPGQEDGRNRAHRPALDEAQPDLFVRYALYRERTEQQPIAGQRFGIRVGLGDRLLHEVQRLVRRSPCVQCGLGASTPPGLIFEPQRPVGMVPSQAHQPVTGLFFRAYAGSGLVIHCLARCQRTPKRTNVARMVSPLTRREVRPCSQHTSAASARVQRLVGLPKARGRWCNSARSASARAALNAAWTVWGREERLCRQARPAVLNARMVLRTV
jgi:hypothetical protein